MPHAKVANPFTQFLGKLLPSAATVRKAAPGVAGDIGGLAAGVGVGEYLTHKEISALNAQGLPVGHVGETGTRLLNDGLFAALGTRFGRGMLKNDAGKYHINQVLKTVGGKAMLPAVPLLADQGIRLTGKANEAAQGLGDLGKATSRAAETFEKTTTEVGKNLTDATGELPGTLRNINRASGSVAGAASNINMGTGDLAQVTHSASQALNNPANPINRAGGALESIAKPFKWVGENPWQAAGIGGGVLAGVGAYTMVRDWLNYRRAQKLRQQATGSGMVTKVANWPLIRSILGMGTGGYAEYKLTENLGMDPVSRGSAVTMGALSGLKWTAPGARAYAGAGGADLASKNLMWTMGGFAAPRILDGAQKFNTAQGIANDKALNPAPGPDNTMRNLGLSLLGAGGLYALIQAGRAGGAVAKGQPLSQTDVHANTTVHAPITAGGGGGEGAPALAGGGGGGAPGTGGTLRVTLPTKNPQDKETQVEIPLEQIGLSNAIMTKLKRDTKRRLRFEGDERTLRINPGREVLKTASLPPSWIPGAIAGVGVGLGTSALYDAFIPRKKDEGVLSRAARFGVPFAAAMTTMPYARDAWTKLTTPKAASLFSRS